MTGKIETVPRNKRSARTSPSRDEMDSFFFLHADPGKRLTRRLFRVFSGIIEDFKLVVTPNLEDGVLSGKQTGCRRFEIIVSHRILARTEFLLHLPRSDDIFLNMAAFREIDAGFGLYRARLITVGRIGKDQGVLVLFMFKEVANAVLLHKAGDKIEIRFAILHTVLAHFKIALQGISEITEAVVFKNLGNDVGNGHILEDAAVGHASEKPQPGDNNGLIVGKVLVSASNAESTDVSTDVTVTSISQMNLDGDALTDKLIRRDGRVLRKQVQVELE